MIVVRLQGGMSNQMFQYATGRNLARLRNTKLVLDTSWYREAMQADGVDRREYELGPFAISEHIFRPNLLTKVAFKLLGRGVYSDEADPYTFHREVLELPDYSRLFGFFQNERYFTDIRNQLLTEFTLKEPATGKNKELLEHITAQPASTSVHIRRGDYAASKAHHEHHGLKGVAYYQQAFATLTKTVKNPTLYVFSDDPEWCKQNIKLDAPTVYVDHNSFGGEDMRLMRACKHNIIANSSFSWWGAWLNTHPGKLVIAPKQWLASDSMDTRDVIPASWRTI